MSDDTRTWAPSSNFHREVWYIDKISNDFILQIFLGFFSFSSHNTFSNEYYLRETVYMRKDFIILFYIAIR